jgi:hypothetical protein
MTREEFEGALAEQRHQYRDLDADSQCCPAGFTCVSCLPAGDSAGEKEE